LLSDLPVLVPALLESALDDAGHIRAKRVSRRLTHLIHRCVDAVDVGHLISSFRCIDPAVFIAAEQGGLFLFLVAIGNAGAIGTKGEVLFRLAVRMITGAKQITAAELVDQHCCKRDPANDRNGECATDTRSKACASRSARQAGAKCVCAKPVG